MTAAPKNAAMKALSIKQHWVYAILREGKDIENRSWKRDFRGWIALHASGTRRNDAVLGVFTQTCQK
jgi:hypothetical protein